jgi:hypothetical protein
MADLTTEAREGLEIMIQKMRAAGIAVPESDVYVMDTGAGLVTIDLNAGEITNA